MAPEAAAAPRFRTIPPGGRAVVFVVLLAAGLAAAAQLGLFSDVPAGGRRASAGEFFSRALSPSFVSESPYYRGVSLLPSLGEGLLNTVVFAAAGLSIAALAGLLLGFFGSTAWWAGDAAGGTGPLARFLRRLGGPAVYATTRVVIALLRSIHELLWAVLLLAAFGRSETTAVLALAIPYSGVIAKLFAEIIDETPRAAAHALRAAGATPAQVFTIGLLPRALPDAASQLFYQFECAIRSSAILGFFGFQTLGYFLVASFENLYYGEAWTWLYAMFLLVVTVELWSGAIRKRLVG